MPRSRVTCEQESAKRVVPFFFIFPKNEMKTNQTKEKDLRQANCVIYQLLPCITQRARTPRVSLRTLLLFLVSAVQVLAQERKVDPSWLHRQVPHLKEARASLTSATCHYKPIFGEGADDRTLRSVSRFGEATLDAHGNCQNSLYDREEEIYFVVQGTGLLQYGDDKRPMRANDFTYIAPGVKHSIANNSDQPLRVLVMGFKIPMRIALGAPPASPKIVNLDDVKEQPVDGHPASVLYKLMIGSSAAQHGTRWMTHTWSQVFS